MIITSSSVVYDAILAAICYKRPGKVYYNDYTPGSSYTAKVNYAVSIVTYAATLNGYCDQSICTLLYFTCNVFMV
jgi:hypothetical protein